jgi:uncharacterized protein YabE (DUF348 family)
MFHGRTASHRKTSSHRRAATAVATASLAAVAVVSGSVVAAAAAVVPTVTLSVDGNAVSVTTNATSVSSVLAQQSIAVDSNDLVSPSLGTPVRDGMTVHVDHRVEVTVKTPLSVTSQLVTADNVYQLKDELALPGVDPAAMKQSTRQPSSWARTLVTRPNGKQILGPERIVEGTTAHVQRIRVGFVTVSKRTTPLLTAGTVRVQRAGHDGRAVLTVRRKFVNGAFVNRQVLGRDVRRAKQNRLVLSGSGPNWRGLAQCESGNNPRAVNPAGFYGLYQFSQGTWAGVGGSGNPADASRMEQTKRAWILYQRSGASPWPVCGAYL